MFLHIISFGQLNPDFNSNTTNGCSPLSVSFKDFSTGNPTSYYWDFGNGKTSISKNPVVVYTNPGSYDVSLKITNSSGSKTIVKNKYITIFKDPVSYFNVTTKECADIPIQFEDKSTDGSAPINIWYWDFGDGTSSNQQNPIHSYSKAGKYDITLVVTDQNKCTNTTKKTKHIEINRIDAEFKADQTEFCTAPATVNFSDLSFPNSSNNKFKWEFGDGQKSTLQNPVHTYSKEGKYSVNFYVEDVNGCKSEILKSEYIIIEKLKPDFDISYSNLCVPSQITFTNKSTPIGKFVSYWDFGDNTFSKITSPTHTYYTSNTFTVKLIISNASCSEEISKTIKTNPSPLISFDADTQFHCHAPFWVKFSNQTLDADEYFWDFGDNHTSKDKEPQHRYDTYGAYSVKLEAKNKYGCKNKLVKNEYIISEPSRFDVDFSQKSGCIPFYSNYSIIDSSFISLTNWIVQCSNGQTKHTKDGSLYFSDTGVFTVKVIGTNSRGCKYEKNYTIVAGSPPHADFLYQKYIGCNNPPIQFTNKTNTHNPKADYFEWDFGDGKNSNKFNPVHKYQDTGWMTVKLTASFHGCADTHEIKDMIYIYPPIAILADNIETCEGEITMNFNKSIGGHLWYWDFGDGTTSNLKNPIHTFKNGEFWIKLTVTDTTHNCVDTDSTLVRVLPQPLDNFSADKRVGCENTVFKFKDTATNIISYFWNFGDGKFSTLKSPEHLYTTSGNFNVSLKITDKNGCVNTISKTKYIRISDILLNFDIIPQKGCVPLEVKLVDNSSSLAPIIKRQWDMGNGDSFFSTSKMLKYTYEKIPLYLNQSKGFKISLSLEDTLGCIKDTFKIVNPSDPIPSNFNRIKSYCKETEALIYANLNDTMIYNPATVNWYINEILVDKGVYFKQTFTQDSTFYVKMVVTDANGCQDSLTSKIKVEHKIPVAEFDYFIEKSINNCPPLIVGFINKSKRGTFPFVKFTWDFGDNTSSFYEHPNHSYFDPGSYSVSLIVQDSIGCLDTVTKPDIILVNGASGRFWAHPIEGCDSILVTFNAITKGDVLRIWDFGDGMISNDSVPTHLYNFPGVFDPVLILEDTLGCLTSFKMDDHIFVYKSPKVQFDVKRKMTCYGQKTQFINNTQFYQPITSWYWDFGDGENSKQFEPVHSYQDLGTYDVSLIAIDSAGCLDTLEQPSLAVIYYDTIRPKTPYYYSVTQTYDPEFDEMIYSFVDDYDFENYVLFRTNKQSIVQSFREIYEAKDTVIQDTMFNFLVPQCYFVMAYDYCGNISNSSKLHCMIYLNVNPLESGNKLSWTPYIGWKTIDKYEIYRKEKSSDSFTWLHTVDAGTFNYLDTNIRCANHYYYLIKGYEKDGYQQVSYSNADSGEAIKTTYIDPVKLIRVSVENTNILMEWENSNFNDEFQYSIFRSLDNKKYDMVANAPSSKTSYIDKEVNTNEYSYYYYIKVQEKNCGHFGRKSNLGKSILLDVNKTKLEDEMRLVWTFYKQWDEGVNHYNINYLDPSTRSWSIISKSGTDSNVFEHYFNQEYLDHCYMVTAIQNNNPNIISNSNIDCDQLEPKVQIPNSFTPNEDGLNDLFFAKCFGCKVSKMQIFNRWGEEIYNSESEDAAWNGYYNGDLSQTGVYYYQIFISMPEGKEKIFNGSVMLLR